MKSKTHKVWFLVKIAKDYGARRIKSYAVWAYTYNGGIEVAHRLVDKVKADNKGVKGIVVRIETYASFSEHKKAMDSKFYQIFTEELEPALTIKDGVIPQ
jgi:hypothetical protein